MKLITKALLKRLPPLYATENIPTPKKVAVIKFFTPDSSWTWYGIEYDPTERLFFGLVHGIESEMGYFSLDELEEVRGRLGLPIERDRHFKQTPLGELLT